MRYELTDLRLFFAIAEAGNLSAGAASLFMSASSASYRIKNLEKSIGTPLFVRSAQGMHLTSAGESALGFVREILELSEDLDDRVRMHVEGVRGKIRVVANSSSLNGFLLPAISEFLVQHPSVDVEVRDLSSRAVVTEVLGGRADIGILAASADLAEVDVDSYAQDEMVIVCDPGHALAARREISLFDALDYDFVSVSQENSNFLFLSAMAKHAGKPLRIRLHTPHFDSVLTTVSAGAGIALVPRSIASSRIDTGHVHAIALSDEWSIRQLKLVTRKRTALPEYVSWFRTHLLSDPPEHATRS